jgi:hypothetical protein
VIAGSPWAGLARWPLRAGLAAVCAVDVVSLAAELRGAGAGPLAHPGAPGWLLGLGGRVAPAAALAALALVALALFCAGRRSITVAIAAGAVGLGALALLTEACAALAGGPARNRFLSGAMLLGWIVGLLWARLHAIGDRARAERLGEAGAAAALAATYAAAGLSKLLAAGAGWADAAHLRAVILSHRGPSGIAALDGYVRLVVEHPSLARALAGAAVAIQAGSLLYLAHPRLRMLWGALIIGFHLNVQALTGIGYYEATFLAGLFSFPWGRLGRRRGSEEEEGPAVRRGVVGAALVAIAALIVIALLSGVRDYTGLHHRPGVG